MADKLVLGENAVFSTDSNETHLNNNITVEGCTGSGKTVSLVIPMLLNTFNRNQILTDPKRELFPNFAPLLKSRGYNVPEINLINPNESTICLDPLKYIESSSDVQQVAESIANMIPQNEHSTADNYWDTASNAFCNYCIYYCLSLNPDCTIVDVIDFIAELEIEDSGPLIRIRNSDGLCMDSFPRNHPIHQYYKAIAELPAKTAACVFSTLRAKICCVFNEDLKKMIRTKPSLDFEKFIKEKNVLFISCPSGNDGMDAYVNMIYENIMRNLMKMACLQESGALPIPVNLIMDDFASSKIKSFPKMITTFRSKGISSVIIFQDENQIIAAYGEPTARTIINNADSLVYLGGNDIDTAKNISVRMNVPLDDILYMPLNQMLIFRRGERPIITKRYDTFHDPEYIKAMKLCESDKKTKRRRIAFR